MWELWYLRVCWASSYLFFLLVHLLYWCAFCTRCNLCYSLTVHRFFLVCFPVAVYCVPLFMGSCFLWRFSTCKYCNNYRGISLLPTTYKILSNILLSRLVPYAKEIIGDYQCGFRRNRSTIDHIFFIRQMLEKK
jgi:hypothetical protein